MSYGPSILAFFLERAVRRHRVMKGETKKEAQARWAREELIERARSRDPRLDGTGRVAPILYDD